MGIRSGRRVVLSCENVDIRPEEDGLCVRLDGVLGRMETAACKGG